MYVLMVPSLAIFCYGLYRRYKFWRLGKPVARFDRPWERLRRVLVHVLGHGRFLRESIAGLMHGLIFWSMLLLFIGTVVVAIDTDLRIPIMRGWFYLLYQSLVLDVVGALGMVGLGIALVRRYVLRVPRLQHNREGKAPDPSDWVTLLSLFLLFVQGFALEAIRIAANPQPWDAWSVVGYALSVPLRGLNTEGLIAAYQFFWWFHTVTVFGWIAYLPWSKMAHFFTSLLDVYFSDLRPPGEGTLQPIDFEKAERLGVSAITDFTWKDLLDLDACTACGRCQDVCPAYAAGQPLSPKNLILDLRDYVHAHAPALLAGKATVEELPPLVGGAIKEETLWACTTCRACMEECPVFIEHVPKIVEMRRHLVMEQASAPETLQEALKSLEDRAHPYKGATASRTDWCEGLEVPLASEVEGEIEVLYWVGCTAAFDPRNQKVARALAQLLHHAGVKFAILGPEEACCGDPARRMGNEFLYDMIARQNIEILRQYRPKRIVTACPHCQNALGNEYRQFGGDFEVVHHTQLLKELVESGRLKVEAGSLGKVTFHDPCYLGRWQGEYEAPRDLLDRAGADRVEMERSRSRSFCCGAGGAHAWMEETGGGPRVNQIRAREAAATGAQAIATACPFCMQMMEDGVKTTAGEEGPRVLDVAELLLQAMEETGPHTRQAQAAR
nr:MAG: (Fe-S)-binding protein [Bacillota bacterium]